ncbi:unnamed protein product [Cuscuta campestris]|uniref:Glutaredoxin domain-containing protein n=2 Tax=Cuscuta sect. Cleistogrammica TaxID=1824901 RepID=A0A484KHK6_9ASTE|nr:hypothetical protein DM860_004296 [Cuscuta australis]VFQ61416.1 unnamed protein product [Cuscuta campestris]
MAYREDDFQNPKPKGSPYLNRSVTVHHGGGSAAVKPSVERMGSFRQPCQGSSDLETLVTVAGNSLKGKVKKLCSLFENKRNPRLSSPPSPPPAVKSKSSDWLPGTEDRVVIYFTSLRGIRRTFDDCYRVRMILKSYRVNLDERDISMDIAYKKELQSVIGEKNLTLPQVFIKGKRIGGAEAIKQLNEAGELVKLLRGLPLRPPGYVCEGCGDARFVPCSNCNGSRKLFDDKEGQLRKCSECNENGLVRCPLCCH